MIISLLGVVKFLPCAAFEIYQKNLPNIFSLIVLLQEEFGVGLVQSSISLATSPQ
jgi:hypothetical protein